MSIKENFQVSKRFTTISIVLMALGILAIIGLYVTAGSKDDPEAQARFWASLLMNSVYFLLITNASMFFICATTLAFGGWQIAFRRIPEAIASCVPIIGVICGVILLAICFGSNHEIYHWSNAEHVKHDPTLSHKSGFLSKGFFATFTVATIVLWSVLGWKMRKLSLELDENPLTTIEEKKKYIFKNTVWGAVYLVVFALTVLSTIPWLWLMSINAHWYSTMYSWYTFASTFVAGCSLIALFFIYTKSKGYLELANFEHLHDIGKFMFAFSIFWTYLWFSQFMLIWYANIPEETVYFKPRVEGQFTGLYWAMFMMNFIAPILILMSRDSKRSFTVIAAMAIIIIFGHWLDVYQMVMPGVTKGKTVNIIYDYGVALGFIGLIMFVTAKTLARHSMLAKHHPFVKESLIHHT